MISPIPLVETGCEILGLCGLLGPQSLKVSPGFRLRQEQLIQYRDRDRRCNLQKFGDAVLNLATTGLDLGGSVKL